MIKKMKYIFLSFIILSLFLTGCWRQEKKEIDNYYTSSLHGIKFLIPDNFKITSKKSSWKIKKWTNFKKQNSDILLKIKWDKDLKFFELEHALDIYMSKYRNKHLESNIHLVGKPIKFPLSSQIDGLSFKALDRKTHINGIYATTNNREYILIVKCENLKDKDFISASEAIKRVKINALTDNNSYARKLLEKNTISGTQSIKEMLDYGQQLKTEKEDYANKYPLAIKEIRKALEIMQHLSYKPELHRALRLMSILKDLQENAFEKLYIAFTKARYLKMWEKARDEASAMINLMSDDPENPSFKYAKNVYRIVNKRIKK